MHVLISFPVMTHCHTVGLEECVSLCSRALPTRCVLVNQAPDHLLLSRKVREGLADVISHEMLTNQILLFHCETPWLQYNTGEVLGLLIKQAVNYE